MVAQLDSTPGTTGIDRCRVRGNTCVVVVLQFDLHTVEQAIVSLAVGADMNLGLFLEFPSGPPRRMAVVGSRAEGRVAAQGYCKLRLCPVNRCCHSGAGKQGHP